MNHFIRFRNRMQRRYLGPLILLAFVAMLLMVACGPGTDLDQPPEIAYGEDTCGRCGMIISEPLHSAAYVTTSGDVRRFDDIGGMLAHDQEQHEAVHLFWVHDWPSAEWIDAAEANFVVDPQLMTPMGWGLAAFADKAAAEAYSAERDARLLSFDDLTSEIAAGKLDPRSGMSGSHQHGTAVGAADPLEHETD